MSEPISGNLTNPQQPQDASLFGSIVTGLILTAIGVGALRGGIALVQNGSAKLKYVKASIGVTSIPRNQYSFVPDTPGILDSGPLFTSAKIAMSPQEAYWRSQISTARSKLGGGVALTTAAGAWIYQTTKQTWSDIKAAINI
jgi:hypothetical protein